MALVSRAVAELPSITVVTPCLNAAATIEDTLASVHSQGYPLLEHVVVDGGSTDGTLEILERTEGIRWISEPDDGMADALNKGVRMATGEVVGEMNADDVYEPGALLAVGEAMAENPDAEWLTGLCRIVDEQGREIRRPITAYKNFFLRRFSLPLFLTQNFVSTPATFARRDTVLALGGFNEEYRNSMDYDLWLRLARRGDPVVLDRYVLSNTIGFENQFREHALQARLYGDGHPVAMAANQVMSRLIVVAYRGMQLGRRLVSRSSS
jgi:glycosyltransferase involved in cell wall biosynthesis